jgi:hypothetical protein
MWHMGFIKYFEDNICRVKNNSTLFLELAVYKQSSDRSLLIMFGTYHTIRLTANATDI